MLGYKLLYFSLFCISFLLQESEQEIEACHLKVIGSDGLAGLWYAEYMYLYWLVATINSVAFMLLVLTSICRIQIHLHSIVEAPVVGCALSILT